MQRLSSEPRKRSSEPWKRSSEPRKRSSEPRKRFQRAPEAFQQAPEAFQRTPEALQCARPALQRALGMSEQAAALGRVPPKTAAPDWEATKKDGDSRRMDGKRAAACREPAHAAEKETMALRISHWTGKDFGNVVFKGEMLQRLTTPSSATRSEGATPARKVCGEQAA